jgi:DNA modification methylase
MKSTPKQLYLPLPAFTTVELVEQDAEREINRYSNKLDPQDRAFHDWYRFILSFPPHLVRHYLEDFGLDTRHVILDPFCGTGTTLVESKLRRVRAIGFEATPPAHFAASVKIDWEIDPDLLLARAYEIAKSAINLLKAQGIDDNQPFESHLNQTSLQTLAPEATKLLLTHSISPLPLHKTLILLDCLKECQKEPYYRHLLLALANALVFKISNFHFGPEVGVGKLKNDVPVVALWLLEIEKMAKDLRLVAGEVYPQAEVHLADARQIRHILQPNSIDAVITSPPYPNEKDYTRTTRLEAVILGFIKNKADLRELKQKLIRSNTRGVYKDDDDDKWIAEHPEINAIAEAIEKRRIIIELKRDKGHEQVVGQISLYMSWIRENLAKKNQRVIGIICGSKMSPKLLLAAKNIQGLEVFEYGLTFRRI